ncbi:MAG: cytosolic protein [Candidatus Kapabacteria bacterium]|jgi:hypothetical protein|nr:cytosolic protein [Candidatus Kapabacteria bacterium]
MESLNIIRNNDYDTPWKEAIELFFPEFMTMFFPEAAREIDWTAEYEFLDKELQQIVRDAELGKRFADKLVRVQLRSADEERREQILLLHIEVQGQVESDFAKRMFVYHYRLFDKYDRRVASMALLTDEQPHWRPQEFSYKALGCSVQMQFPVCKMSDFADDWQGLETSTNPFAIVVMAHLKAQQTRGNMEERLHSKIYIARALYKSTMPKATVLELMRFLDWLITLPEGLQEQFTTTSYQLEDTSMPYYADFELKAMNKGLSQGFHQSILILLESKFPGMESVFAPMVEDIHDIERLRRITAAIASVQTVEEAKMLLTQNT